MSYCPKCGSMSWDGEPGCTCGMSLPKRARGSVQQTPENYTSKNTSTTQRVTLADLSRQMDRFLAIETSFPQAYLCSRATEQSLKNLQLTQELHGTNYLQRGALFGIPIWIYNSKAERAIVLEELQRLFKTICEITEDASGRRGSQT